MSASTNAIRSQNSGFTLIETLLALSALALFALPLFALYERSASALSRNQTNIQQAEFAYAVLNEIEVIGYFESRSEIYRDRYVIDIVVNPASLPADQRFQDSFELLEITVTVDDRRSSSPPYEIKATMVETAE